MEGAHERRLGVARSLAVAELQQAIAHALAQLAGGALGERDRKDPAGRHAVLAHRSDEALDEHRGLAAARGRRQQQRLRAARDGLLLLVGERAHLAARPREHAGRLHAGKRLRLQHRHPRAHRSHRQIVGYWQPPLNAHVCGRASSSPARRLRGRLARHGDALRRAAPAPRRARAHRRDALELQPAVTVEHAARAQVAAGERLVEAAHRTQPEQLLDGAHVQRHLQVAVLYPLRRARRALCPCSRRRPPSRLADVDAVDAPAQPHPAAEVERRQLLRLAAFVVLLEAEPQLQLARRQRAFALGGVLK